MFRVVGESPTHMTVISSQFELTLMWQTDRRTTCRRATCRRLMTTKFDLHRSLSSSTWTVVSTTSLQRLSSDVRPTYDIVVRGVVTVTRPRGRQTSVLSTTLKTPCGRRQMPLSGHTAGCLSVSALTWKNVNKLDHLLTIIGLLCLWYAYVFFLLQLYCNCSCNL